MTLPIQQVESLLFYLNEEVSKKRIADMVGLELGQLEEVLEEIKQSRQDSGIVIVETPTTVTLGTHPDCADMLEQIAHTETVAPLSKAALETLSVILYKAPITRSEIDTIRGVNSLYSVRNLLVRGLVSRRTIDGSVVYESTAETLELLGLTSQKELPDYNLVLEKIDAISHGHADVPSQE